MSCYACIHLMTPEQSADGVRRCRANKRALPVSPALEADCKLFVREVGADDAVPPWYAEAWVCDTQGRGD